MSAQPDTTIKDGTKLWLWKNGDHYLAFNQEYPTFGGGDPMTLGEPAAVAVFRTSEPPAKPDHNLTVQMAREPGTTSEDICPICLGAGYLLGRITEECCACGGSGKLPVFDDAEWERAKDEARYGKP